MNLDFRARDKDHPNRCKCDDDGDDCKDCTCATADDPWGSVVVLIPYLDPVIAGKAVYHCHIAEHEDAGMMQVISMSPDAGRCEAGKPSSVDRLTMSPTKRAVCKPRGHHKHGDGDKPDGDADDHGALEQGTNNVSSELLRRLSRVSAAGGSASAHGSHSPWTH